MTSPGPGLVGRLVLVTVLAGTLAAVAGAALLNNAARSTAREEVLQRGAIIAQELAMRFDSRLATADTTLRIVASHGSLTSGEPGAAAAHLRSVLRTSAAYDELILFGDQGQPIAAAANAFAAEPGDYPGRSDIAAPALAGRHVTLVPSFPPLMEMAVPVEHPPGSAIGFLLARMPLETFAAPVEQRDVGTGATGFLVDAAGRILVHPERDLIAAGRHFAIEELDALGGVATVDFAGARVMAATAPLETVRGAIIVTHDEALALRPAARTLADLVMILAAVLVAAMVGVSLAGGRLLRPLGQLADAVNRLGRGQRGVRVAAGGSDEIGALSAEFNRMAQTLDQREVQLAELQRLSLLVNAAVDRGGLVDDLVRGARTLLQADRCEFVPAKASQPAVEGEEGDEPLGTAGQAATDAGTAASPEQASGAHRLSVPVTTLAGAALGMLLAEREGEAFTPHERSLAVAFASFAGVALDNARRLQLEQRLVHELQDSVERRRMLLGGVTHEFRTPLTCIEGFSSELQSRWDQLTSEDRGLLLGKINAHAKELDRLVTQLLDFAATERARSAPSLSVAALGDTVREELSSLAPILGDRPLHVAVPEIEVIADVQMLRGILDNLISNAVKYSPPGTPITVRATLDGDGARIEVSDEGIGMTPEEIDLAFQPFWRAPGARAERGTGLGLALVAEYVRAMNGTLTATSELGKGSTFSFTLAARVREVQRDRTG